MSRKDMRREIDEEMSIYERRFQELKTRRNSYAEIAMLPPELLVYIFRLVQAGGLLKEWHHINHVCRHWRDTAIKTPILWTNPPTHNENYTSLMLERSKPANLSIFLGLRISTATITAISNHVGRIQGLTMLLSADQIADVCGRLGAPGHLFSRLESLAIQCTNKRTNWTLPPAVMEWSTSLHSLSLKRFTFDWQMITPLDLRYLCLESIRLTEPISRETLLHTLTQMQRLQHLVLYLGDFILPYNAPTIEVSKVALPHLQSLHLSDSNPHRLPSFLSCLLLPKLHSLVIEGSVGEPYSLHALKPITTILANADFRFGAIEVSVLRNCIEISDIATDLVHIWLPQTSIDHDGQLTRQLLKQIVPIFPDLIRVTIGIPLSSSELTEIFGTMHRLKIVTVLGDSTLISSLTGALTYSSGQEPPSFSTLDTICCYNFDWDEIVPDVVVDFCNALLQRPNGTTSINTVYCHSDRLPQWAMDLLTNGRIHVTDDYLNTSSWF